MLLFTMLLGCLLALANGAIDADEVKQLPGWEQALPSPMYSGMYTRRRLLQNVFINIQHCVSRLGLRLHLTLPRHQCTPCLAIQATSMSALASTFTTCCPSLRRRQTRTRLYFGSTGVRWQLLLLRCTGLREAAVVFLVEPMVLIK